MPWNVFFVLLLGVRLANSVGRYGNLERESVISGYFVPPPPQHHQQTPLQTMVEITNNLGVAILKDNSFSRGNYAFSPYGVASVLVVLYEGARGESARQISRAVGLPRDKQVIRIGFSVIHRHLRDYFSHDGFLSGISLNKVNSNLTFEYKKILELYGYDVERNQTDFHDDWNAEEADPTTEPSFGPLEAVTANHSQKNVTTEAAKDEEATTAVTENEKTTTETTKDEETVTEVTKDKEVMTETTADKKATTEAIKDEEMTTEAIQIAVAATTTEAVKDNEATAETLLDKETVTEVTKEKEAMTETMQNEETTAEAMQNEKSTTEVKKNDEVTTEAITDKESTAETTSETAQDDETTTEAIKNERANTGAMKYNPDSTDAVEDEAERAKAGKEITTEPPDEDGTTETEIEDFPREKGSETRKGLFEYLREKDVLLEEMQTTAATTTDNLYFTTGTAAPTQESRSHPQPMTLVETSNAINLSRVTQYAEQQQPKLPQNVKNIKNILNMRIPLWLDESTRNAKPKRKRRKRTFARGAPELSRGLTRLPFLVDGTVDVSVPMMTFTNVFPYAYIPWLHAKALVFPLDDVRYKLLILSPVEKRGLSQLINDLPEFQLSNVLQFLRPSMVRATVPTFAVEGYVVFTSSLKKLGILDVFDPHKANLSGMTTDPQLYVRNVEQSVTVVIRNYVDISDVQTRTMEARHLEYEFEATHPFLYFVLDSSTNVALMAGQMLNPLYSRLY